MSYETWSAVRGRGVDKRELEKVPFSPVSGVYCSEDLKLWLFIATVKLIEREIKIGPNSKM